MLQKTLLPLLMAAACLAPRPGLAAAPLPAIGGPVRTIPAGLFQAVILSAGENRLQAGGAILTLAPGARIRSADNLFVVPTSLVNPVVARFSLDANDQVKEVWILSDPELAQAAGQ